MKDEIRDILKDAHRSDPDENRRYLRYDIATDQLMSLMCYREVRAIYKWVGHEYFLDYEVACIQQLSKVYPAETVEAAIEQVKKEMK